MVMNRYELGLYEKAMPGYLSMAEKLRAAKKAGYDYVELSIDETDEKLHRLDSSREKRLELIDIMYQEKIAFRSILPQRPSEVSVGKSGAGYREKKFGNYGKGNHFGGRFGYQNNSVGRL